MEVIKVRVANNRQCDQASCINVLVLACRQGFEPINIKTLGSTGFLRRFHGLDRFYGLHRFYGLQSLSGF
jgi:hypothetical protein